MIRITLVRPSFLNSNQATEVHTGVYKWTTRLCIPRFMQYIFKHVLSNPQGIQERRYMRWHIWQGRMLYWLIPCIYRARSIPLNCTNEETLWSMSILDVLAVTFTWVGVPNTEQILNIWSTSLEPGNRGRNV